MDESLKVQSENIETHEENLARRNLLRALTLKSIKKQRTNIERWETVSELSDDYRWDDRARATLPLLPTCGKVLDLGCGDMKIEKILPNGCTYVPLDVVKRDDRTIVVDLNKKRLPTVEVDCVVGMGVLEYLFNVPSVLRQLARQVSCGLFSYHPLERSPLRDRLAVGWVNALNSTELIALFKAAGYKKVLVTEYRPALHFYSVSRS